MSDPRTVWEQALGALDESVTQVERALAVQAKCDVLPPLGPTWQAPAVPLPADLAPRVVALLGRHQQLTEDVQRVMAALKRRQRTSSQLQARLALSPAPPPVYIDRAV